MSRTGEAVLSIMSNTAEQLDEMSGVWPLLNVVLSMPLEIGVLMEMYRLKLGGLSSGQLHEPSLFLSPVCFAFAVRMTFQNKSNNISAALKIPVALYLFQHIYGKFNLFSKPLLNGIQSHCIYFRFFSLSQEGPDFSSLFQLLQILVQCYSCNESCRGHTTLKMP